MKTSLYPRLIPVGILLAAIAAAPAGANTAPLAWQEPGYVTDVVIATAPGSSRASPAPMPIIDLAIAGDSDRQLREKAAEAVRDALAANRIFFEGLTETAGKREPAL